jgi:hypothetical protein
MNRARRLALGMALTAALAAGAASASGPYQVTGTVQSRNGNLLRTELVVQAGPSPLDPGGWVLRSAAPRWSTPCERARGTGTVARRW